MRRRDFFASEAGDIAKAQIIRQDDDEVRSARRGLLLRGRGTRGQNLNRLRLVIVIVPL